MDSPRDPLDPEFKKFLDELGLPPPGENLVDDEPPEAVNADKLRAFHRQELTGPEAEWVGFLVSRYRAWHDANLRIVEDERGDQSRGEQPAE